MCWFVLWQGDDEDDDDDDDGDRPKVRTRFLRFQVKDLMLTDL